MKPQLIKYRPVGTTYVACQKADQVPLLIKKLAIIGIGGEERGRLLTGGSGYCNSLLVTLAVHSFLSLGRFQ